MKLNVYSVFDVKAAVYANPFYMPNDLVAIRGFTGAVNSPDSMLYKHPEDYMLYRLGSFNDSIGLLEAENPPVCICTAASVVVSKTPKVVDPELVSQKTHIAASVAK